MSQQPYTGMDNLEVMEQAVRYNRHLMSQVLAHSRGARRMLDFGAGSGTFARALREQGANVACVEPDPAFRATLLADGFACHAGLESVPPGSVDFIYMLNVLEHVQDDGQMLRELAARLSVGGGLYVYVPAFNCLYSSMDRKVGHVRRYRRGLLTQRIGDSGLELLASGYADSLGFFIALLYRLVGSRNGDLNPAAIRIYDRLIFPISRVLDAGLSGFLGKNVWAVARRTESSVLTTRRAA